MIGLLDKMLATILRRFGVDPYFGRAYPSDPRFLYLREPGSVEVIIFGWTMILSRHPHVPRASA